MTIQIQNNNIFLKDIGKGDPILFLHGVPDTSDIWNGIICQLKEDYRCIAPDWPGFGRSDSGTFLDCSLNGHADFVNELSNTIGLKKPFNLVAHDFGGISAMAFVSKYPERVHRFIISNAPFSPDYKWHFWAKIWRTPVLGKLSLIAMKKIIFYYAIRQGSRKLNRDQINAAYRYFTPKMKQMILRMYRALPEKVWQDWNVRLLEATSKVPMLILWGQNDPYLPNWLPEMYGAKKIRRYKDSGHWVPLEEKEEFVKELRSFFSA